MSIRDLNKLHLNASLIVRLELTLDAALVASKNTTHFKSDPKIIISLQLRRLGLNHWNTLYLGKQEFHVLYCEADMLQFLKIISTLLKFENQL